MSELVELLEEDEFLGLDSAKEAKEILIYKNTRIIKEDLIMYKILIACRAELAQV